MAPQYMNPIPFQEAIGAVFGAHSVPSTDILFWAGSESSGEDVTASFVTASCGNDEYVNSSSNASLFGEEEDDGDNDNDSLFGEKKDDEDNDSLLGSGCRPGGTEQDSAPSPDQPMATTLRLALPPPTALNHWGCTPPPSPPLPPPAKTALALPPQQPRTSGRSGQGPTPLAVPSVAAQTTEQATSPAVSQAVGTSRARAAAGDAIRPQPSLGSAKSRKRKRVEHDDHAHVAPSPSNAARPHLKRPRRQPAPGATAANPTRCTDDGEHVVNRTRDDAGEPPHPLPTLPASATATPPPTPPTLGTPTEPAPLAERPGTSYAVGLPSLEEQARMWHANPSAYTNAAAASGAAKREKARLKQRTWRASQKQ